MKYLLHYTYIHICNNRSDTIHDVFNIIQYKKQRIIWDNENLI